MTEVPYAHDDLGEEAYDTERGGPVDRHIDGQEAHNPNFYSKQGPQPFGA